MKPKRRINKHFKNIIPILLFVSTISLGFSSWVFGNNEMINAELNNINIDSSNVKTSNPLELVSIETNNVAISDDGIFKKYTDTPNGTTFTYVSMNNKADYFEIKWTFDLDNSLYRYNVGSAQSPNYMICVKEKLIFTGIYNDISPYQGKKGAGADDIFLDENDHGWLKVSDFPAQAYDSANKTQIIKSRKEFNIKNRTPQDSKTRFYLRYFFVNFAPIMGARPFTISLRLDLKYNQI